MLSLTRPIEEGIVKNWDDMEKVWSHAFGPVMHVDAANTRILLTEAPLNPLKNREKLAEVMFERFGFGALTVEAQATLALYAVGKMTGIVLDSGDGVTHCIPVSEGMINSHSIRRLNLAGRHLTEYMIKLLLLRGYGFNMSADFETVREIKEKTCYVACKIDAERKLAQETTVLETDYQLPDGSWIKVGRERFEAAEALFAPYLLGREEEGMSEMLFSSIMSTDMDTRKKLFSSIVLSGGSTMYPGTSSRIKYDIKKMHTALRGAHGKSAHLRIEIFDPPYRKNLVFIGASTVGKIYEGMHERWVYKDAYEEEGVRILHSR
jgi:actin-related protein 2